MHQTSNFWSSTFNRGLTFAAFVHVSTNLYLNKIFCLWFCLPQVFLSRPLVRHCQNDGRNRRQWPTLAIGEHLFGPWHERSAWTQRRLTDCTCQHYRLSSLTSWNWRQSWASECRVQPPGETPLLWRSATFDKARGVIGAKRRFDQYGGLHYNANFSSFNAISVHSRQMNVTFRLREVDSSGSRLKRLAAWTDQRSFQSAGPSFYKEGHII